MAHYEAEPKPFFSIPIEHRLNNYRQRPITYERFTSGHITGQLKLQIRVTGDHLFTGSGQIKLQQRKDAPARLYYPFNTVNKRYAITGSGVKGSIRTVIEAVTASCPGVTRDRELRRLQCDDIQALCTACRLFGTTARAQGYKGRVSFQDALMDTGFQTYIVKIGELHGPRVPRNRKFYQNKRSSAMRPENDSHGHKIIQVVKKDTTFATTCHFDNLTTDEFALLVNVLGVAGSNKEQVYHKLGGAKPRSFGSVQFSPVQLKIQENPFLPIKQMIDTELSNYLAQYTESSLFHRDFWDLYLENIAPKAEKAPQGLY